MELTSITLYGYSVIDTIVVVGVWLTAIWILIVILKIPFFFYECGADYFAEERKEGESDVQFSRRRFWAGITYSIIFSPIAVGIILIILFKFF